MMSTLFCFSIKLRMDGVLEKPLIAAAIESEG